MDKVPNGTNQDPQYNKAILFVVFQLASSHSFQLIKLAWEAVREAFCLHSQTIKAEIFRSGEVAIRYREIHDSQKIKGVTMFVKHRNTFDFLQKSHLGRLHL